MLKYIAACICITVATPMAMAEEGLDETGLDNIASNPQFASLHYFTGDWRCIDSGEGGTPNNLTVLHVYGTLKHWYAVETITFGDHKTEGTTYMSYSPHKQEFIEFGLCNHGCYGHGKAPGWQNGALTFTGYAHNLEHEGHHWRKTLSKIDDSHFGFKWETSADGNLWTLKHNAVCAK